MRCDEVARENAGGPIDEGALRGRVVDPMDPEALAQDPWPGR